MMNGLARISFGDGALVMPARNGYDRELVFEQAEFYARRHGRVTLELDHREMLIKAHGEQPCSRCEQRDEILMFALGDELLCRPCARKLRL